MKKITLTLMLLITCLSAHAEVIWSDDFGTGGNISPATGWILDGGNGGAYNPLDAQYSGHTAIDSRMGWVGVSVGGMLSINTGIEIAADTTYTLTYDLGMRADSFAALNAALIMRPTTSLDLTNLASQEIGTAGIAPAAGVITTGLKISFDSSDFVSKIGEDLVIVLWSEGTGQSNIDNLSLEAVPEPLGAALLAFGAGGILLYRRFFEKGFS